MPRRNRNHHRNLPLGMDCESEPADPPLAIEVHVGVYDCRQMTLAADPLERKRQSIWHNEPRNHALAEIAQALVSREEASCWSHGLLLKSGGISSIMELPWPTAITVVVESLEHATALSSLLPDFAVFSTMPQARRCRPARTMTCRWIMTLVAASQQDHLGADVVINAVGGPHALVLDNWPSENQSKAILIDVADQFDMRAERDTEARLIRYSRTMRQLIGAESVLGRDPRTPMAILRKDARERLIERCDDTEYDRRQERLHRYSRWLGRSQLPS